MDNRAFYDRISGAYDLIADTSEGACRDRGLELLGASEGERILEIGFGTGHALVTLAKAVGPAGHVYGIDVSQGMLAVARHRMASSGWPAALSVGDLRSLSFRDAVFDAAFMSFTLELLDADDVLIALRDIGRVLKPAGRLGIVAMAATPHTNAMTEIYKWLHRHFPHFVDCRPIDVVGLLGRTGFRPTREETMSIWGLSVVCAVGIKARPTES